jgi:DNA-binding Xre family transcriptional regulator
MTPTIGYVWHLRKLMAERGMFATTELVPLLADRGVRLSREQVYRLVTGTPERLSLTTLVTLCDILGCRPGDLIEPVAAQTRPRLPPSRDGRAAGPPGLVRPRRARVLPDPGGRPRKETEP